MNSIRSLGNPPSRLTARLSRAVEGEVLTSRFDRGRYATDASFYQIMPAAVVVPKSRDDVAAVLAIAAEEGVPVLARGGGTSQSGQAVGPGVVLDFTKYLNKIIALDPDTRAAVVDPGIVLDQLNKQLRQHGLWFPVDVSTASRATIGGMAGNNSCGARSLVYGMMRDNVGAIDALMADGTPAHFGPVPADLAGYNAPEPLAGLAGDLLALGEREADEIRARMPALIRRVGGYNVDALIGDNRLYNLAHLLVGSEGTLAVSTRLHLKLSPLPRHKVMGICHFPTFRAAMEAAEAIVGLKPSAVELMDATMLALARDIPLFRPVVERFVRGDPQALLMVEFAGDDAESNQFHLKLLATLMGDLGYAFSGGAKGTGGVVEATEPALMAAINEVRSQGLNIMMSMKSEGKPVSFIEDCAVPLGDLADYTERLTEVFARHGTTGTWYAHASVGCLHVRPVLNLKLEKDVKAMRAIAEEAFAMVRAYKGSHSGEHGDGLVRSEFHEAMFGRRMVATFEAVKDLFDPKGVLNPGKIVRPPRMDDRNLFRFPPDYKVGALETALDWSGHAGAGGGFQGAIEMCNNNGACRKFDAGVMCPSFRVTGNERDLTRGRANTLRLAISGQLGPEALTAPGMAATMALCVSCKACRRECPTGVDMARMKIEVLSARAKRHGLSLRDRLVAWLPRYAPWASRARGLMNLRNRIPLLARAMEKVAGIAATRPLPVWRKPFDTTRRTVGPEDGRPVVLFADTFNTRFEPENLEAALAVLVAAGYRVTVAGPAGGGRPLCCGRTFLAAGLVDEAKAEAVRLLDALEGDDARSARSGSEQRGADGEMVRDAGVPVIGLEPSCLLTLRDEYLAMGLGGRAQRLAQRAFLFEEFLAAEAGAGRLCLELKPVAASRCLLHGHCHQKAFGAMPAVERVLRLVPGLEVETVATSCCGMAGAFGYQAETLAASKAMGELTLMPAVRAAAGDTIIAADGTSCRHQIADGAGRNARHVATIIREALP